MTAKSSDTALYVAKMNGKQVYELVENYLADADENFYVTNKYELPIASGMKMIVNQAESGFSLKDLTVNDKKIDKERNTRFSSYRHHNVCFEKNKSEM